MNQAEQQQQQWLERIRDLMRSCANNDEELPIEEFLGIDDHELYRYFAIEYSDGDILWGYNEETLEKLAEAIDQSETRRDSVEVFDLDSCQTMHVSMGVTGIYNPGGNGFAWEREDDDHKDRVRTVQDFLGNQLDADKEEYTRDELFEMLEHVTKLMESPHGRLPAGGAGDSPKQKPYKDPSDAVPRTLLETWFPFIGTDEQFSGSETVERLNEWWKAVGGAFEGSEEDIEEV